MKIEQEDILQLSAEVEMRKILGNKAKEIDLLAPEANTMTKLLEEFNSLVMGDMPINSEGSSFGALCQKYRSRYRKSEANKRLAQEKKDQNG